VSVFEADSSLLSGIHCKLKEKDCVSAFIIGSSSTSSAAAAGSRPGDVCGITPANLWTTDRTMHYSSARLSILNAVDLASPHETASSAT